MRVQIAAHHVEVTGPIRQLVEGRADHLMRFFDGVTTIHVTLRAEKERRAAEFVANVSHGAPIVAKAEAESLSAAIHGAVERMETQLRRYKDRIRDHRAHEPEPAATEPGAEDAEDEWELEEDETSDRGESA